MIKSLIYTSIGDKLYSDHAESQGDSDIIYNVKVFLKWDINFDLNAIEKEAISSILPKPLIYVIKIVWIFIFQRASIF